MPRFARPLVIFALILVPFLAVAALVYYNVEREIVLHLPLAMRVSEVKDGHAVNTRNLSQTQKDMVWQWLTTHPAGWKKMWGTPPPGERVISVAHRQARSSALHISREFFIFSNEDGHFFRKVTVNEFGDIEFALSFQPQQ